jgi:hypothetical protein
MDFEELKAVIAKLHPKASQTLLEARETISSIST